MCAIGGYVDLVSDETTNKKMLATMLRRGPDGNGVYRGNECTLLHTRLAIIDPTGGKQPMELEWEGKRYCLVYNGELYNTQELRYQLLKEGHQFLGHSDTEVVLHSYAQWGPGCVDRFNGIFAFALWEEGKRRLFLARDRIGVKPLFYSLHKNGLIFGSEIKTILQYPGVSPSIDETGAGELLLLGPGRTPGSGVFRGIYEVEPGCCGYYQKGKLELYRYWKLMDREHQEDLGETAECIRYLVTDAIKRQMVSDVPIGTFLSGGLDSSLITAICAGEMKERGEKLHTFSVDYENNDRYFTSSKFQPSSDSAYIRKMQEQMDTLHHWTVLTPEELLSVLEDATIARDLPGMADVDFSLLAFCAQVRKNVKVALSGECADEIFGGYPWYRDPEIRSAEGFPWAQNTVQRSLLLHPSLGEKNWALDFVRERYLQTCRESDILPDASPQERRMKEMVNLNFRWFMQTLLDRKDRMSMYSGLEVRVPFCDYRIAEYLYSVPWELKDLEGREKGLLRYAMKGILPDEILCRKKSPYPKTFDPKYATMVSSAFRVLLDDPKAPIWNLCNREVAEQLLTREYPWPWYGQLMRGPQTMVYLLQLNFWLRYYQVNILF